MSKYYKAEDVIRKRAEDLADTSYWEYGNPKNVDDWIEVAEMEFKDLPTIDIVHCKDCKYWLSEDDGTIHVCEITEAVTNADDFCSYGERKSIDDLIEQADNLIAFGRELIGDCNICRFAGCSECDDCINGSQFVRMTKEDEE